MVGNEYWIKQQVLNKIKNYNRQRLGLAVQICMVMAFLLLSPIIENEFIYIRFSVFCSTLLLFCSLAFILSFKNIILFYFIITINTSRRHILKLY